MSGGSFGYLYTSDPTEMPSRVRTVRDMAEALMRSGIPRAKGAATELNEYADMLEATTAEISRLHHRLADVMHAVEWWYSSDWGKDQVAEALAEAREKFAVCLNYAQEHPDDNDHVPESKAEILDRLAAKMGEDRRGIEGLIDLHAESLGIPWTAAAAGVEETWDFFRGPENPLRRRGDDG